MTTTKVHPQIASLRTLQAQDRRLTALERQLAGIPRRLKELDTDLVKLEQMLDNERTKLEDTRAFQTRQEIQLVEEEELVRNSKAKLGQIKTSRELNATQREIETTRRMITARTQEISKLREAVSSTETRIAKMDAALSELRSQATVEKERLTSEQAKLERAIRRSQKARSGLTSEIERDVLRKYERIRKRTGGMAFVPARRERCTACKMMVAHINYMTLLKGQEIVSCENCHRLLYWAGHFPAPDEGKAKEPKPKAAPAPRKKAKAKA